MINGLILFAISLISVIFSVVYLVVSLDKSRKEN